MRKVTLFIAAFALAMSGVTADAKKKQKTDDYEPIDSEWYVNYMQDNLPAKLCAKDHPISYCFKISNKKCIKKAETLTRKCIAQASATTPKIFKTNQVLLDWSAELGKCVGRGYLEENRKKLRKNKEGCRASS